ncbi:putative sulfate exporter family transporter, partial [Longimicrobium sp.]|uniref:putative sulfate exporter family transporter n=1 Tax=Longimicrobium sp. TaxID=2029185 RepID=UPI002F9351DE
MTEPRPPLLGYLPGLALSATLAAAAWALQEVEVRVTGHAVVEALVLAILLGMMVRTFWKPGARWEPGISLTAKQVLEI